MHLSFFQKCFFMKFNVGDRVKRTGDTNWAIVQDKIYTVRKIINDGKHILLRETSGHWNICNFELIESNEFALIEIL